MGTFIRTGVLAGLAGLIIMFALWMGGLPPKHFWLLALWPSQLVGMGTDGVSLMPEMALQFVIYAMVGIVISLAFKFSGIVLKQQRGTQRRNQ